jgi:hypothetical protein
MGAIDRLTDRIIALDDEIEALRKKRQALYNERAAAILEEEKNALDKWRSELTFGTKVKGVMGTGTVVLAGPKFNPESGVHYMNGVVLLMMDDRNMGCPADVHGEVGLWADFIHNLHPVA